jgi:hypothetical protein
VLADGSKERAMARKAKAKQGRGNKPYKVYTRPELYEEERPFATWLLRAGILGSMLAIATVFRQPLRDALLSMFGA